MGSTPNTLSRQAAWHAVSSADVALWLHESKMVHACYRCCCAVFEAAWSIAQCCKSSAIVAALTLNQRGHLWCNERCRHSHGHDLLQQLTSWSFYCQDFGYDAENCTGKRKHHLQCLAKDGVAWLNMGGGECRTLWSRSCRRLKGCR